MGCLGAVALLVVIIVVIALAVSGSHDKKTPPAPTATNSGVQSTGGAHPPAADVSITSCSLDSTSFAQARLHIVNHSSKSSNYAISVEFTDPNGTRVGEGAAAQNNLAPGEKAEDTAGTFVVEGTSRVTCKVTSVDRYSAVG
ncbi:FxLYD domain-containing protein [Streptomyces sp. NPDC006530]|uniref:FxLYD domain-containing protein n=1 Tax=Streptomyces sp. NPDC006530 TaxID=3364750 RepID=UPI0036772F76